MANMDDIDRFLSSLDMFSSPTIDAGIAQARSRELLQEHEATIPHASTLLSEPPVTVSATPSVNTSLTGGVNDADGSRSNTTAHSRKCEFVPANSAATIHEHRATRKRARHARNEHANIESELDKSLGRNVTNHNNTTNSRNEIYNIEDSNNEHENENNYKSNNARECEWSKAVNSKWTCNRCTLINDPNTKRCEACNALRSKHGVPYVEANVKESESVNTIPQHTENKSSHRVECNRCHCINFLHDGSTQLCHSCGALLSNSVVIANIKDKANELLLEITNSEYSTKVLGKPLAHPLPLSSSILESMVIPSTRSVATSHNQNTSVQVSADIMHERTSVEDVKERNNAQESNNTIIIDSDSNCDDDDSDNSSSVSNVSSVSSSGVSSDDTLSELSDEEDGSFHTPHSQSSSDADAKSHDAHSDSVSNTELVHFLRNLESVSSESLPLATLPISMRENGQLEPFQLQAVHWMLQREHRLRRHTTSNSSNNSNSSTPLSLTTTNSGGCINHSSNNKNGQARHANVFRNTLANDTFHAYGAHDPWQEQEQEQSDSEELMSVKGGILADYMGLGKTRSLLALCESTRGPRADRVTGSLLFSSATLIIAPTSVLSQWVAEIKKCVRPTPRVLLYHGTRKKKLTLFMVAQEYDYVLTSYHSVRHEPALLNNCQTTPPGKLYMIQWQRIILDEAHHIRNIRTQQCKACLRLTGIHKWVVTATPVQNSVNDLFPLLKFLSVPYFGNITWWNREIVQYLRRMPHHPRPTTALKMLFAALLLRRTPESRIAHEPILRLPEKRVITSLVTLSPQAREIYNFIYRNATSKLGRWSEGPHSEEDRQGSRHTLCQFSTAFEMLLRCRQSCLHPYIAVAALRRARGLMPDSALSFSSSSSTPSSTTTTTTTTNNNNESTLRQTKRSNKNNNVEIVDNASSKENASPAVNASNVKNGKNAREYLMEKFITRTLMGKLKDKDASYVTELTQEIQNYKLGERECIICLDTVQVPVILPCAHVFCQQCITHAIELQHRCPMCKRKTQAREFLLVPDEVLLSENNVIMTLPEVDVTNYNNWDLNLSAKTKALLDAIESIPHNEKVVVFSSFVTYLTYLQHCLSSRNISCVMFTGKLSLREKDKVLQQFNTVESDASEDDLETIRNSYDDNNNNNINNNNVAPSVTNTTAATTTTTTTVAKDDNETGNSSNHTCKETLCRFTDRKSPRVLLATISTCGVGITLTTANHCFMMEPTWNPAQEEQAMNRIHRIGQTRPVTITRFVTDDTVETRIDALCQQKKKLEGFIGDGQGGSASRLTMHDLLRLFQDDKTNSSDDSSEASSSEEEEEDVNDEEEADNITNNTHPHNR